MPYLAATGFHTWMNDCFAAFACWLGSVVWVWRASPERRVALLAADAVGLLLGGLFAGLLEGAWLWWSGTMPCARRAPSRIARP